MASFMYGDGECRGLEYFRDSAITRRDSIATRVHAIVYLFIAGHFSTEGPRLQFVVVYLKPGQTGSFAFRATGINRYTEKGRGWESIT